MRLSGRRLKKEKVLLLTRPVAYDSVFTGSKGKEEKDYE
jgi:hypothetical protein